jgi:hypothetical protein
LHAQNARHPQRHAPVQSTLESSTESLTVNAVALRLTLWHQA